MSLTTVELRPLPQHASYSQLTSWLDCGERYFLSRGTTLPDLPSWALIGGSTVHAVTEKMDRLLYGDGVGCAGDDIREMFLVELQAQLTESMERHHCTEADVKVSGRASKAWPDKENRSWWEHNGPAMCMAWRDWQERTPWQLWQTPTGEWGIELELEVSFGGGPIKLAIDRIYEGWGQLIVVDLKSGREPMSIFQLGQYSAAIEQVYGVRPMYGSYWMSRTGENTAPASLVQYTQKHIDSAFRKFSAAKEAGIFLPHPSQFCGSCGVRDFCSAKGTRASEVPRPYMEV